MSEILSIANNMKELGVTALVVGAAIWLLVKWLPQQSRQEGEISEVIRHCSAVIENNTQVLKMVSVKDTEVKQALERIEQSAVSTSKDVRYLKISSDAQVQPRRRD